MAHEIDTTVNANGAAIYAREPAWHGLGVLTPDAFTSAEALNVAGLNFHVETYPTFTLVNGVYIPFKSKLTTVREDTNVPLGIVGPGYCPMQTEALFAASDDVLKEYGAKYEAAGVLRGGARVWILARLPEAHKVTDAEGDEIAEYLLWLTSHDGSSATWCLPTPTRVVCANTLAVAIGGEGFAKAREKAKNGKALRVLHTANQEERLKGAREMFLHAHNETLAAVEVAREMSETPATPAMREATIEATIDAFVGSDIVIMPDGTPRKVKGRESQDPEDEDRDERAHRRRDPPRRRDGVGPLLRRHRVRRPRPAVQGAQRRRESFRADHRGARGRLQGVARPRPRPRPHRIADGKGPPGPLESARLVRSPARREAKHPTPTAQQAAGSHPARPSTLQAESSDTGHGRAWPTLKGDAMPATKAGQVYKAGPRAHVRVEQVRSTGGTGLKYALARRCDPTGTKTKPSRFLSGVNPVTGERFNIPITIYLMPDGEMPPGYTLKEGD